MISTTDVVIFLLSDTRMARLLAEAQDSENGVVDVAEAGRPRRKSVMATTEPVDGNRYGAIKQRLDTGEGRSCHSRSTLRGRERQDEDEEYTTTCYRSHVQREVLKLSTLFETKLVLEAFMS